ncbi:MAG: DUF1501 domain-containing protein [Planctomycetes bacterium]|nr:DUF1501 domain-containing protein [Planctomycetota bacterium]
MFTISTTERVSTCQGISRRSLLQVGGLALGGLSLSGLLAGRAVAAQSRSYVRNKSVVFLFLQGGPSHIELFDPKMTAPVEIRSITGEVKTKLPGVTFGGTFPKLAAMANRLSVVRSFASGNTNHQDLLKVASGGNAMKAPMGAVYSRLAGTNHPRSGMPTNVFVPPEAAQPGLKLGSNFETKALPQLKSSGSLGAAFAAFDPSSGGELKENLQLRLPRGQFEDRRKLLSQLDTFRRRVDASGTVGRMNTYQQQAYELILRGVAGAFDLAKEDARTLDRYDSTKVFRQEEFQRYGDMKRCSNLLGRQLLMARRLCEAGCGFVTVSDSGWDMHSNGNSPKFLGGMYPLGSQVDFAVSAFLEDVRERGLSDDILLVISGEMGRTPRINKNGGRDHWGNLTPLLLAGGGLKMGQVIGASDRTAAKPATKTYTPAHLLSTVMHTLFDPGQLRITSGLPKDVAKLASDGEPITELF